MGRREVGRVGAGRPHTVRLRLILAWQLGALLVGPLGSATPGVAPRVAPTPVYVAPVSIGGGQMPGRLTHRGAQPGSLKGRAALATAADALGTAKMAPQGPGTAGVPVGRPSLDGLVPVVVSPRAPARFTLASARGAFRGWAPPAGGTFAIAGPSFPLPA
jgi:hypothetical protein